MAAGCGGADDGCWPCSCNLAPAPHAAKRLQPRAAAWRRREAARLPTGCWTDLPLIVTGCTTCLLLACMGSRQAQCVVGGDTVGHARSFGRAISETACAAQHAAHLEAGHLHLKGRLA
jgi:hypothetical protein